MRVRWNSTVFGLRNSVCAIGKDGALYVSNKTVTPGAGEVVRILPKHGRSPTHDGDGRPQPRPVAANVPRDRPR